MQIMGKLAPNTIKDIDMTTTESRESTCCTCEYKWVTGQDGSHSCSRQLISRMLVMSQSNLDLAIKYDELTDKYIATEEALRVAEGENVHLIKLLERADGELENWDKNFSHATDLGCEISAVIANQKSSDGVSL